MPGPPPCGAWPRAGRGWQHRVLLNTWQVPRGGRPTACWALYLRSCQLAHGAVHCSARFTTQPSPATAGTLHLQMGVQAFADSQWAGAESHLVLWAWEEAHEPCISGKETPGRPPARPGSVGVREMYRLQNPPREGVSVECASTSRATGEGTAHPKPASR